MNSVTAVSPKLALSSVQAIFWGGLVAGTLDAIDGVIAYATQGLNPIQVLQYIASGALGKSAFEGGLTAAALGGISLLYRVGLRGRLCRGKPAARHLENACSGCGSVLRRRSVLLHELRCIAAICRDRRYISAWHVR
jgi:hypothetical protein